MEVTIIKAADGTLPIGGEAGQVIIKNSNADNDVDWSNEPSLFGNILNKDNAGIKGIALGVDVLKANASKVLNTCVLIGQGVASKFNGSVKNVVAIGSNASEDDLQSDSVAIGSFSKSSKEGVVVGYSGGSGVDEITAIGNYTGVHSKKNTIAIGHRVDSTNNGFDSENSIFISTNKYTPEEDQESSIVIESDKYSIKNIKGEFQLSHPIEAPSFVGNGSGITDIVTSFKGRTGPIAPAADDYKLDDLQDVELTSLDDLHVLQYSADKGQWTNLPIDVVGGDVSSVFGRKGDVVAMDGDYSFNQLDDIDLNTLVDGQMILYDAKKNVFYNKIVEGEDIYFDHANKKWIQDSSTNVTDALMDLDRAIEKAGAVACLYDAFENKITQITRFGRDHGFIVANDLPDVDPSLEGSEIIVIKEGDFQRNKS